MRWLLLLLLTTPVAAQGWSRSNTVWLGVASAAIATDCLSTAWAVHRGSEERNPLLGTHPSDGRITTVCAAGVVVNAAVLGWFFRGSERNWAWGIISVI